MNELALLLRVFAAAVLRAFFPALFAEMKDSARDRAEDSRPQPELRTRLQDRVRARWGRAGTAGALLLGVLLSAGCGTKVVYVPSGEAVRLRQDVKKVKVWVMDADGVARPSRMTLSNGWYALPVPDVDSPEPTPEPAPATPEPVFAPLSDIPTIHALPAAAPAVRSVNP